MPEMRSGSHRARSNRPPPLFAKAEASYLASLGGRLRAVAISVPAAVIITVLLALLRWLSSRGIRCWRQWHGPAWDAVRQRDRARRGMVAAAREPSDLARRKPRANAPARQNVDNWLRVGPRQPTRRRPPTLH